ncbi:prepilin-type N-terminal cleavage/methylation domain-containing protein [Pseudoalteromonas denitrificans]|jgi:prepilin-type N-terminal cleavage/methylation domain-containing protein|uniref:Prepilin-type N-terminal cleavage/methylation domain-containing protein n=1 Tax=Pseudoalteromonas denitrificans DSM 6059 TaxID=1123010 RepID=A0A1I1UVA2_9GAMM|nr:prepilin-type N-terminal cleavage/methylation domain-containing protein [Pseudoalteromonas denitrificans]SFD74751.1 prepilin-type N-terminal cleavage/methylation domain-containing protein [Pseudoalteromonas denitrificans DSM 6059]
MKQKGFTLIELIIVIVILGILAITASTRFLNIQSDARIVALKELKRGMNSAAHMI